MIEIDGLHYQYSANPPVFSDYSLTIDRKGSWAVLGPSGSGKTTLLYLLAGLRSPSSGSIRIDGMPINRPRPKTGLILQDYGLLPWATVRDNARLGQQVRRLYGPDGIHSPEMAESLPEVDSWLERLGILEIANIYPANISGGQRQRVAIARTLALLPDLLLMDEPFSSLDAATRQDLQALVTNLCRDNGITLVIVTHSIEEAVEMGRHILILTDPPNSQPVILQNPGSGQPGYNGSEEYLNICKVIREKMGVA